MHRRMFAALLLASAAATSVLAADAIDIGSRRELFVDRHIVDELTGGAALVMHKPEPREVALVTDAPWEGNTCAYYAIFQDGDKYRMYYRGSHVDAAKKSLHPEFTCYAESADGVHWTKPALGLVEFNGSKENNIVWNGVGTHCFTPFLDTNPDCAPDARYKAISRGQPQAKAGLYVFKSPDGIHWSMISDEPVITRGAFDSQNLAFWDPEINKYREYHRFFDKGVRAIMTGESDDFVHWPEPTPLAYVDSPDEHLYTNAVLPYFRAPHFLLGFPTRYLPNERSRVEPVLMASRDGRTFHRWPDPLIPEDAPDDRSGNRSNYMAWGLLQLPGNDKQLSVYATEAYYTGPDSRLRRFTFRVDGFASLHADSAGGGLVSRPVKFAGDKLELNFATRDGGKIRVELQDETGAAIEGFALDDCEPLRGDSIDGAVGWRGDADLGALTGRPIRLRFELHDADVYSFRVR